MASSLSQLKQRVSQISSGVQSGAIGVKSAKQEDPRFFYPKVDPKTGIGYAVLRFLPAAEGSKLHWGHLYSHGFKEGNKWYIENCPTTIGGKCPVCESNSELWATELESNKAIAKDRKRKETYYYNVLVVSHPANPEDEGTVRIFRSGPTIFKMLLDAQKPKFPGDPVIDAFDPWNGADFILRIYKDEQSKQTKYDQSRFGSVSPMGNDEFIEKTWLKCHNLDELSNESVFKSYEDLKKNLDNVIGAPVAAGRQYQSETPKNHSSAPERTSQKKADSPSAPVDEDDALKMFEDMANS